MTILGSLVAHAGAAGEAARAGGYQIEKSLRFNSADTTYLARTPASAGNRKTFTWSGWVKRSKDTTTNSLFSAYVDANNFFLIQFRENADDGRFEVFNYSSGFDFRVETNALLRDPSAWYHIVVALDTTQSTDSNRIKIYVNGTQQTLATTSYPSLDFQTDVNNTNAHYVGQDGGSGRYHNGYLTEVNFIDGSALDPTSFGEFNSTTGVWQPKAYEGSYGTNGFYLPFNNTTSTYDLTGDQKSGTITRYTTAGTYSFTVPAHTTNIVVELWGGGGGSGGSGPTGGANAGPGGASTFAASTGTLSAGGGGGGATSNSGLGAMGAGGTASGGDVNTNGTTGTGVAGSSTTGYAAPNGYWNSLARTQSANGPAFAGLFAGGAATGSNWLPGAGSPIGGSGGSGAYVKKTYSAGTLTVGESITVVVGAGGTAGAQGGAWAGSTGAAGEVRITVDGVTTPADWFPGNISIASGASNDSLVDTPTPYGKDTGAGGEVRGNYCTLNPLQCGAVGNLSNGNLQYTTLTNNSGVTGTIDIPIGEKIYIESNLNHPVNGGEIFFLGVANQTTISSYLTASRGGCESSSGSSFYGIGVENQTTVLYIYKSENGVSTTIDTNYPLASSSVVGIAVDRVANDIELFIDGVSVQTLSIPSSGTLVPYIANAGGSSLTTCFQNVNFGQRPFTYAAPTGFKALCTTNLPKPTIVDSSTAFNAVTYSGTGSNQSITVGFQPDFIWTKSRTTGTNGYDHGLWDVIRGFAGDKALCTNGSEAEGFTAAGSTTSQFGNPTSLTSTGYTVTAGSTNSKLVNETSNDYVTWNWKAGGSGVANGDGTIPSTVSVNRTAGFSIVTYTGNETDGASVGHGLGVAPSMIIIKNRTDSASAYWCVYHKSAYVSSADPNVLYLNTTATQTDDTNVWGSSPEFSGTIFKLGDYNGSNGSGDDLVAYCFAPVESYSAFGSYLGNNSSDGPFVYTGFRPRWVMVKEATTSSRDWIILDTARNTYNVSDLQLLPNTAEAENTTFFSSTAYLDILSNGFKVRNASVRNNESGATYIYAAFAENPFKYSLAR